LDYPWLPSAPVLRAPDRRRRRPVLRQPLRRRHWNVFARERVRGKRRPSMATSGRRWITRHPVSDNDSTRTRHTESCHVAATDRENVFPPRRARALRAHHCRARPPSPTKGALLDWLPDVRVALCVPARSSCEGWVRGGGNRGNRYTSKDSESSFRPRTARHTAHTPGWRTSAGARAHGRSRRRRTRRPLWSRALCDLRSGVAVSEW
jgi:hypothetical protein